MKIWDGNSFPEPSGFKVWNGSAFVNPELYSWNGAGYDKLWPNAIEYVSSASAVANTVSTPSHQAGDFIFVLALRTLSGEVSAAPGYSTLAYHTNYFRARVGYKVAASNSEAIGTWTNASRIAVVIYSNVSGLGTPVTNAAVGVPDIAWPSVGLENADNTSWGVRFGFAIQSGGPAAFAENSQPSAPPNTTRVTQGATGYGNFIYVADSNGPITSFPAATQPRHDTQPRFFTIGLELKQH